MAGRALGRTGGQSGGGFISHKVLMRSFYKSRFPYKHVNSFFSTTDIEI